MAFSSSWFVGEWSSCSTSCGAGEKVRRVHCVREVKGGQIEMMVDSQCSGSAPAKYEKCEIKKVCPTWKRSDWSTVCMHFSIAFNRLSIHIRGMSECRATKFRMYDRNK